MLFSLAMCASVNTQCFNDEPLPDTQLQRHITDTAALKWDFDCCAVLRGGNIGKHDSGCTVHLP